MFRLATTIKSAIAGTFDVDYDAGGIAKGGLHLPIAAVPFADGTLIDEAKAVKF